MPRRPRLPLLAALAAVAGLAAVLPASAAAARPRPYVPGQLVVGLRPAAVPAASASAVRAAAARAGVRPAGVAAGASDASRVVRLRPGESVPAAARRLRRQPGVAYAVPNYRAHVSSSFDPDDRGRGEGWAALQWNFLAPEGVDAPAAWANLIAAGRPGGRGVRVAVVDTGIAYKRFGPHYPKSPDFAGTRFVAPYDFVGHDRHPYDLYGHGTHVAGTIAEQTDNGTAVTGLAYGASIMPVRVLDKDGYGDAATIAKGLRYAANHGAKIINLSFEFPSYVHAAEIPDIVSAMRYAARKGSLVVAAAGNEGAPTIAYPARGSAALAVGSTTPRGCLAEYSNSGKGLALVAPGGGRDADLPYAGCEPGRRGRPIYQMTFTHGRRFGLPNDYTGTSMSAAHAAGVAALVVASGVIGRNPSPRQIVARLEQTARDLGPPGYDTSFGFGLLDAGAATSPATWSG
jgi:serine protease